MLDQKLDTLLTLYREGNFTKTSEALKITQPAVSTQIKMLEQEYGCKLFYRTKNNAIPTEQGMLVINYASRIKALNEKLKDDLKNGINRNVKLRIGITHTAENSDVAEVLGKYSSIHDNISITMVSDNIKNLYRLLENYELDLIIVEEIIPNENFNYISLDTDELLAIVCNDHKLAKENEVTLDQIKKEKMILNLPGSDNRQLFENTLASVNDSIENFNIILEVDSIITIKHLVRKDIGISILPKSSVSDNLKKGKITVLPIKGLKMVRETSIVYPKDFIHKDILDGFVELYNQ